MDQYKGINLKECYKRHFPKGIDERFSSSSSECDSELDEDNRPESILSSLDDNIVHCYPENVTNNTNKDKKKPKKKSEKLKISELKKAKPNRFSCLEIDNETEKNDLFTSVNANTAIDLEGNCLVNDQVKERLSTSIELEQNCSVNDQIPFLDNNMETVLSRRHKKKKPILQDSYSNSTNEELVEIDSFYELNYGECYFAYSNTAFDMKVNNVPADNLNNPRKKKKNRSRKKNKAQAQNVPSKNDDCVKNKNTGAVKKVDANKSLDVKKNNVEKGKETRKEKGQIFTNSICQEENLTKGQVFINEISKKGLIANLNSVNVQEFIYNVIINEMTKHFDNLILPSEVNNQVNYSSSSQSFCACGSTLPIYNIKYDEFPPLPPASWLEDNFPPLEVPEINYNFEEFPPVDQLEQLYLSKQNFPHLHENDFLLDCSLLETMLQLDQFESKRNFDFENPLLNINDSNEFPSLNSSFNLFTYDKHDFPSLNSSVQIFPFSTESTSLEQIFPLSSLEAKPNRDIKSSNKPSSFTDILKVSKDSTTQGLYYISENCSNEELPKIKARSCNDVYLETFTDNIVYDENCLKIQYGESEQMKDFICNSDSMIVPENQLKFYKHSLSADNENILREKARGLEDEEIDEIGFDEVPLENDAGIHEVSTLDAYTFTNENVISFCEKVRHKEKPSLNFDTGIVTLKPSTSNN